MLLEFIKKNKLFIGIILFTSFLRLFRLEEFATFLGDQGRDALIVKDLITLQDLPALGPPSSVGQVYLGPFYYYLISPFLPIFSFNPVGLAFAVAFLSIIGLIATYVLLKKDINKTFALFFTTLMSFSFVNISFSRFSWNPNLLPLFSFFTLYFFIKAIQTKKNHFAILFGLFLGFSTQLHHLAFLLLAPVTIISAFYIYRIKKKINILKQAAITLLAFLATNLPLILFELKHNFLNTQTFIRTLMTDKILNSEESAPYFNRLIDTVLSLNRHVFQLEQPFFVILLTLVIISLTAYLIKIKKNKLKLIHIIFILNTFTFIISFALLNSPRHPHYYGTVYVSYIFLLSYIIYQLWQYKNKFVKYSTFIFLIAYLGINLFKTGYIFGPASNQIAWARDTAFQFVKYVSADIIQIIPEPIGETDGHIRYFVELKGIEVLPEDSPEIAKELYVMCFPTGKKCMGHDYPHFQVAAFPNKQVDQIITVNKVKISKIISKKD